MPHPFPRILREWVGNDVTVLSALVNLGYQRPAAEKAIEQAVAKEAALEHFRK